ncbi:MAG: ABC transporter ATP-binding protein [Lachnospiraceae bacterium]|nr:ABC transporter ATP-binding protein [Lachnospiraceae bacterium]
MKRLLTYMKPVWKTALFAMVFVIIGTLLELYEPILVGNTIDRHITGYDLPYVQTADGGVSFAGERWEKLADSPEETADGTYGIVVLYQDGYYWADGLTAAQAVSLRGAEEDRIAPHEDGIIVDMQRAGGAVPARPLTRTDLKTLRGTDFAGILRAVALYGIILIALFIIRRTQYMTLQKMGQKIVFRIRQDLFAHVESLSMRFFDTTPVGTIVTRITNDVETLNEMYANILVNLVQNVLRIIGIVAMMLLIDVRMTGLTCAMLPVVIVLTYFFRKNARRAYDFTRTQVTAINIFLSEHLSGMRIIQTFRREAVKELEFGEKSQELYRANFRELMTFAIFRPAINMAFYLSRALVLAGGAYLVLGGRLTLGTLYIFTQYTSSLFEPIQDLAEEFSSLQHALSSADKIFRILDEKPVVVEKEDARDLTDVRGEIRFEHVWFAYNEDQYVLKDVDFTIRPGERIAFVGATGAGKTSILSLIGRYYDIQKGRILIDGQDIRDLTTDSLRRAIGQVQQDVFIFTGDIAGNIRLREESIPDSAVEAAAKAGGASHFIERLPQKYHEPVTERGSTLSAGERQLLSFARTLAFDPRILILDEATANIDTETERLIQNALERLMEGRTSIMVAHRLSTIESCDRIIVLDHGEIVEMGNHAHLMEKRGRYYDLYMSSGEVMA